MREPLTNMGLVHEGCLPPKPDDSLLAGLAPGDYVKIIRGGERFWCIIRSLEPLAGEVNNDLVLTDRHGLRCGDMITLERSEVIEVLKGDDRWTRQEASGS